MTKDDISKIKEHIEIHARREPRAVKITEIVWRAVCELEHITELEKENTGLKLMLEALEGETPWKDIKDKSELIKENAELKDDNKVMADNYSKMEQKFYDNLTKAKELLKQWVQYGHVNELLEQATLSFINSEVGK